ncbi:MAG: DUF4838 domain-containing protein [Verrucomicrobia bacterium]|nr:DUF4838 domain-containing protein [Verrucomicrobiota bacterium]
MNREPESVRAMARAVFLALCVHFLVSGGMAVGRAAASPEENGSRVVLWDAHHASSLPPPWIVIPPGATGAESFAAKELQTYLGKITGQTLVITNVAGAEGISAIILGSHPANADLGWKSLTPDEFILEASGSRVRIAGGRAPSVTDANGKVYARERGTLYGVCEFLEQLGVRWYRPEPWGEHVPKLDRIEVPVGKKTHRPAYAYRYGLNSYRWWKDQTEEQSLLARVWATRNRQNANMWTPPEHGGYRHVDFQHAYFTLVPQSDHFKAHPEYFALIDGVRKQDEYTQLCLGNPEVQKLVADRVIEIARRNPQQEIISLEPNDMSLWCQCPLCTAMDDRDLKAAAGGGVSMANRVCAFNNIIARKLAEAAPGVKAGWLAYNLHTEVPTVVKSLAPNTVVQIAAYAAAYSDYSKTLEDPSSPPNARFLRALQGYGKLTQVMTHEYWSGYAWFGPFPLVHTMADRLRNYRKYGVVGVYSQSQGHWGPQGLELYMYCKLLWNPDLDVARELALYYQNYYGPAAAPMQRYHEALEAAARNSHYYGSGGDQIEKLFTDDFLKQLGDFIQQARAQVHGKEPYEKRLEGVGAGYEFARQLREFFKLKQNLKILEANQVMQNLEKFVLSYKDGDVFDNGPNSFPSIANFCLRAPLKEIQAQADLLGAFQNPKVLQIHDKEWRFQTDPKDAGVSRRWFAASLNDANWARIDADRCWQEQGYLDYHGVAWYRKRFDTPSREGRQRVILYFGAVDGDAAVYVNGKLVGEHNLTPPDYAGWDQPFHFDITDALLPDDGENLMAVRVKKDLYVAGIFKGVRILRVEGIYKAP